MTPDTQTTPATTRTARPAIVKNAASSYFSAVDLSAGEVLAQVGEGRYPHTAVFHPGKPLAYLLYVSSAHVEVLDLADLETVQRVEDLGTMPVGSTLAPAAEQFFVGTGVALPDHEAPGVVALDVRPDGTLERAGQRPLSRCTGMRTGPGGPLYVGQKEAGEVAVLDADPGLAVLDRYPTGEKPHDMYVLADDDLLVVNNAGEAAATFVDTDAGAVRCHAETGENPHGFAVAEGPDYRYGLFPAREDDRVGVVDLDAVAAGDPDPTVALVDLGTATGFAETTPDGRYALVDSYDEPFVTVLDLAALEPVERVAVGGEPLHVVFDDEGRECYVGNMARDEVAVLDTAPLADDRPGDVTVARRITGLGEKPSGIFRPEGNA